MNLIGKKGLLLVFVLFLVVGCKQGIKEGQEQDIYSGTRGIEMDFLPNFPPSELYDSSSLNIVAELRNKGAYDLSGSNCYLYLTGHDDSIVQGIDRQKYCGDLEAKSSYNFEGGYDRVEFSSTSIFLPEELDKLDQNLVLYACYEYRTTANPVVCINPRIYELRAGEDACTVRDVGMSGGQGAPVSVDSVEVDMMKGKVQYKIHVSNTGGGHVLSRHTSLSPSSYHSCPFNLEYDDYNVVDYEVEMTQGFKEKCSPNIDGDQRLRLINGRGTIICTFNIGDSGTAYTTPLRISLDYNYMDTISRNIKILRTP